MQIESVKNPKWVDAEHTKIDVVVKFKEMANEIPFTASKDDCMDYGVAIFEACEAGQYGVVEAYVPPAPEPEAANQTQPTVEGAQTL
jgi:hypothetical protein